MDQSLYVIGVHHSTNPDNSHPALLGILASFSSLFWFDCLQLYCFFPHSHYFQAPCFVSILTYICPLCSTQVLKTYSRPQNTVTQKEEFRKHMSVHRGFRKDEWNLGRRAYRHRAMWKARCFKPPLYHLPRAKLHTNTVLDWLVNSSKSVKYFPPELVETKNSA